MKFLSTILVILLSLALASCSLAEDITLPPGYDSTTFQPSISLSTNTSEPSSDPTPTPTPNLIVSTVETTPAKTDSTALLEVSPTSQIEVVVVAGKVSGLVDANLPGSTTANLIVYNTSLGQILQTLTTKVLSDGKYEFTNVPADTSTVYLVTVDYDGVTYDSIPAQFDGSLFQFDMPITVYDSTNDLNVLSITQTHLQFDFSTAGEVQVMALYVISNPGTTSVIVPSDGTTVPFIQIPKEATSVQYQLSQSSSPLMSATNGFALLPGADKQYGIIASFSLPYINRLVFAQPFSLPVMSSTIIVPEGVKVRSDQLTDGGTQGSTGTIYHLYQTSSLASGSTLTLTISGMPGDKPGFVFDQRTWLMIGIGILGLILIGLGIFLFLRERKLRLLEEEFGEEDEEFKDDALGEDRESIMDAIITLDDQYKAGEILKEAYEKRRVELKDRLKSLS